MLAVVVLYRCSPNNSITVNTLRQQLPLFTERLRIFLYDNSPQRWEGELDDGWIYQHDPSNGGIAAAYNAALQLAEKSAEWLLLLDQDSCLPDGFLRELFLAVNQCKYDSRVAAVIPRIYAKNVLISPSRVKFGHCVKDHGTGIRPHVITALNSGSVVRIKFLTEVGGFNGEFWLDFLDYWLYHQIYARGYCVFVSQAFMEHNLSVLDYNQSISYERYRNILAAEMRFKNMHRSRFERVLYLFELALRTIKQAFVVMDLKIVRETAAAISRQIRNLINDL